LSDLLLYLFGLSAWWWVAFLGLGLAVGFRRLHRFFGADRRSFVIVVIGFVVVLLASSGLESMRFHSIKASLPLEPGGLVGLELGTLIFQYLGFTGGTLLLLALIAGGCEPVFGHQLGEASEPSAPSSRAMCSALHQGLPALAGPPYRSRGGPQARGGRRDQAQEGREAEPASPLRIEPAVRKGRRCRKVASGVEKERQQCPVPDRSPRGRGRSLPPLALLDEPSGGVEPPSPETLEFTSRLIERKLADFGVEVKVLAAYPGPVITRYEIEPRWA
jgi:S-DNA-T family DNA segregation ATPase FtsK/SpoIIIE